MNQFIGTGNLGAEPLAKDIIIGGEPRRVCELRVFFDQYAPDGNGGVKQVGGFWQNVEIWREALIDHCMAHLRKGARVVVVAQMRGDQWEHKGTGEPRYGTHLVADEVGITLGRIESVRFRPKREVDTAQPEDRAS
ncbi:MAG: single-stranded DNA-binding protein [Rhodocyclaceae bacterium]|nr:single-stranded DNA-binding protein [Rhodocyclaceae bacterium]